MKVLVAGCFSFPHGAATAGDLLARDLACEWIREAGLDFDVAVAPPFTDGVDLDTVDPEAYSHVAFVCGPFGLTRSAVWFADRFGRSRLIGLDVTMALPLDRWNPFDALIERDSPRRAFPDIAFASKSALPPVVGVCLVEDYDGAETQAANRAIERLVASQPMAVVKIDTRLDCNSTGLRTPTEVEAMLARMDVVLTTRLHGTVLSLKHGVPAIAIDPERGGAKIRRQAEAIGWPVIFNVDEVTDGALEKAFAYCLTDDARNEARACAARALDAVTRVKTEFVDALAPFDSVKSYEDRVPETHRWMSGAALSVGGRLGIPISAFKRTTGELRDEAVECVPGRDAVDFCLFGPDCVLKWDGIYRAVFELRGGTDDAVADVYENVRSKSVLAAAEVEAGGVPLTLDFRGQASDRLEFRVYWRGKAPLTVSGVMLERVG